MRYISAEGTLQWQDLVPFSETDSSHPNTHNVEKRVLEHLFNGDFTTNLNTALDIIRKCAMLLGVFT